MWQAPPAKESTGGKGFDMSVPWPACVRSARGSLAETHWQGQRAGQRLRQNAQPSFLRLTVPPGEF